MEEIKYNNPLKVNQTDKTPLLSYDPKGRIFTMSGVSIPDNARLFYEPIMKWVEGYVKSEQSKDGITINVHLDYFNIASSAILLKILKEFEKIGDRVVINWFYDDEDDDMKEIGDDLQWMVKVQFNVIKK